MVCATFCKQTEFFQTTYCITMHKAMIIETPNKKHILNHFENSRSTLTAMVLLLQHQTNQIFLAVFQVAGTKRMQVVETFRNICHNMPQPMPKPVKWSEVTLWYRHDISCLQKTQQGEMIMMELLVSRGNKLKQRMHWKRVKTVVPTVETKTIKNRMKQTSLKWDHCPGPRPLAKRVPGHPVATTLDTHIDIQMQYIYTQMQESNKVTPKSYLKPFPACERNP